MQQMHKCYLAIYKGACESVFEWLHCAIWREEVWFKCRLKPREIGIVANASDSALWVIWRFSNQAQPVSFDGYVGAIEQFSYPVWGYLAKKYGNLSKAFKNLTTEEMVPLG